MWQPETMTNNEDLKNQNISTQDPAEGERKEDRNVQDEPKATTQAPAEGSRDAVEDSATPNRD